MATADLTGYTLYGTYLYRGIEISIYTGDITNRYGYTQTYWSWVLNINNHEHFSLKEDSIENAMLSAADDVCDVLDNGEYSQYYQFGDSITYKGYKIIIYCDGGSWKYEVESTNLTEEGLGAYDYTKAQAEQAIDKLSDSGSSSGDTLTWNEYETFLYKYADIIIYKSSSDTYGYSYTYNGETVSDYTERTHDASINRASLSISTKSNNSDFASFGSTYTYKNISYTLQTDGTGAWKYEISELNKSGNVQGGYTEVQQEVCNIIDNNVNNSSLYTLYATYTYNLVNIEIYQYQNLYGYKLTYNGVDYSEYDLDFDKAMSCALDILKTHNTSLPYKAFSNSFSYSEVSYTILTDGTKWGYSIESLGKSSDTCTSFNNAAYCAITEIDNYKNPQDTTDVTYTNNCDYSSYPTLKKGSTGNYVKILQTRIGFADSKCDGIFGSDTENVVKIYQQYNDLDVDGIVGKGTWAILQKQANTKVGLTTTRTTLKIGTSAEDCKTAQEILGLTVTGTYAITDYTAIIAFQKQNGLYLTDGWVGAETWNALEKLLDNDSDEEPDTDNTSSTKKSDTDEKKEETTEDDNTDDSTSGTSSDGNGKYIKKNMRRALKIMIKVAQVSSVISQMPTPEDFALMITSDVIAMAGKVETLVSQLRSFMDSYSEFPFEFLENTLNNITTSATNIVGNIENTASSYITDSMDFASDAVKLPTDLINTSIDMYSSTSKAVTSLVDSMKYVNSSEYGTEELSQYIEEATSKIDDKTKKAKEDATKALTKAADKIDSAKQKALGYTNYTSNKINELSKQASKLISELKEKVDSFSESVDKTFGVTTDKKNNSKIKSSLNKLQNMKSSTGDDSIDTMAQTIVSKSAEVVGGIIDNFSIGAFVTACAGMTASIAVVSLGLDKLPNIDTKKILSEIIGTERKSKYNLEDLVEYSPDAYNKYKEQFETYNQIERNKINEARSKKGKLVGIVSEKKAELRAQKNALNSLTDEERKNLKSGIKEIRKKRKKARKGKYANKIKEELKAKLKQFVNEIKKLLEDVRYKWKQMMKTYKESVSEIKNYFAGGGEGDKTVERICDDIEQNCSDIVKLCTQELPIQIADTMANVTMPRALGPCFPNFAQHIIQWFAELKVIIKFVMDLIKYVMNIVKDIQSLATMLLNGINNFNDIYTQIMKLFGLEWLFKLISKIQDTLNSSITDTLDLLENTIEPVYFNQTEYYENLEDGIDSIMDNELPDGMTTEGMVNQIFSYVSGDGELNEKLHDVFDTGLANSILSGAEDDDTNDKLEKLNDTLDEMGDKIVAYRSPLFRRDNDGNILGNTGNSLIVNEDGTVETTGDVKITNEDGTTSTVSVPSICAYLYYHPDLYHYDRSDFGGKIIGKIRRRRKSRFIKKMARKSNKKNGGVNGLRKKKKLFKNKSTKKTVSAWDAFFWYKVLTDNTDVDYEPENEDGATTSKVVFNTKTGSVVLLDLGNGQTQKVFVQDANVQSGDYVNYNGKKYRIK